MSKYTPRRAGKRWREGAPDYILDCFDNKGKTADRYTVMFTFPLSYATDRDSKPLGENVRGEYANTYIQYLGMSDSPTHPQGFSQWGELKAYEASSYRYRVKHQRVRWLDLPEHIRLHVIRRATET